MFGKKTSEYKKLYPVDVLGVEDTGEDDQLQVYNDFKKLSRELRTENMK